MGIKEKKRTNERRETTVLQILVDGNGLILCGWMIPLRSQEMYTEIRPEKSLFGDLKFESTIHDLQEVNLERASYQRSIKNVVFREILLL